MFELLSPPRIVVDVVVPSEPSTSNVVSPSGVSTARRKYGVRWVPASLKLL
jgi:hypothetical protein